MSKIILFLIPIFCLLIFSDSGFYFKNYLYDSTRVYQIIILIIFSIYFLMGQSNKKINVLIIFIGFFLLIFNCDISLGSNILFYLLIICFLVLNHKFKNDKKLAFKLSCLVALTPLLTVIYLIPSLFLKFQGIDINWYQSFENFRMLDDAILPCVFLLWYWLSELKNTKLKLVLLIISSLYLLSFLLNGARSALFAVLLSLIVISITYYKETVKLNFAYASVLISIISFALIRYILPSNFGSALIREGTSGRSELWLKAVNLWMENPIFGIGGNQFIHQSPDLKYAHPHNYIFLWLSEYGLLGLFFVLLSFWFVFKLKIQKIDMVLYGLVIAIFCNALFSGSFVYPLSQMINIWCLAYVFSKLEGNIYKKNNHLTEIIFKNMTLVVVCLAIFYFTQDIFCFNCGNYNGFVAPGFWLDGKLLHLSR